MTGARVLLVAAIAVFTGPRLALAQFYPGIDAPRRGSIEVGGGGTWARGFDVETRNAELTRASGTDGFELFSVDGNVSGFPGAHARVGVYVTDAISVEGGVRYARPKLSFELSGDAESAEDETASETLSQYVFDGSVLFHFVNAAFGDGRGVPFVSAGGGYIRELHEGNELVETGNELHATIGVKYWFGDGDRRVGLRGEVGVSSRQQGFDADDARRTLPLAMGGLTFVF